ncbi:MAG: hypothetical protein CVT47_03145, partial [Thermoplasmata archaeon HGW-Thermoplasmata-2]
MLEESVREWNPWWVEKRVPEVLKGVNRAAKNDVMQGMKMRQIKDIVGVRRCGKTTVIYQTIDTLIEGGADPKSVVFLNFDDPEINEASFPELMEAIYKINPSVRYLFLDEAQQKPGWERWVRTLYDTRKFEQIIVSGSSASLLSSDIARVLSGRHVTFEMYPFSFGEYLRFSGWREFDYDALAAKRKELLHHLRAYMECGGFPEVLGKSEFERKKTLINVFNDIV